MGSSGEATYLEALKQEEALSQKSCGADVQVGMPAGVWLCTGACICCSGSFRQALLAGLMVM